MQLPPFGRSVCSPVAGAIVGIAVALASPGLARADWPMIGHDPSRTAMSTGTSRLARPVIAWRRYMGGSVGTTQMVAADVNGDSIVEVVFISGGKLVAKRPDDSLVWETAPLALSRIDAVRDVDGDGVLDIVATGLPGLVGIFSGRDGHLEWRTRPGTFGPSIGAVRFARLDGDAIEDLYVADASCGSTGQLGDVVYAYNFARGFGGGSDDGAQRLWQLERGREYVCGVNDVIADLDGDGSAEIVAFAIRNMYLFDGRTGRKIASGGADASGGFNTGFSIPYGTNVTDVVDVDGDGHMDIVGYTNNSYDASINSRAVFVVSYDATRPMASRLYVRWVRNVANQASDSHQYLYNGAADFNGDGRVEIATSFTEAGVLTTYVLDGATGSVQFSLPGASVAGVYTLADGERPTLLVQRMGMLEGYRFDALPVDAGAPAPVFSLPGGSAPVYWDSRRWNTRSAAYGQIAVALPGTTRRGLLTQTNNTVRLWDVMPPMPRAVGTYEIPAGLRAVAYGVQDNVSRPGPGVLLARSDGYLLVLDAMLRVINYGDDPEVPLPGMRTGGFYSGPAGLGPIPIAARFENMAREIVAVDSRGVLLRLDASRATLTQPPIERWNWPGASFPLAIDENGDGAHDLIVAESGDRITGRRPDGTTGVFNVAAVSGRRGFAGDVVPLRGAGGLTFAAPTFDSGTGEGGITAVRAGGPAWTTVPVLTAGSGQGNLGVDDLDGDGTDDVMMSLTSVLHAYSGATGLLFPGAIGLPIYTDLPMTVRGMAGATVTHIASGSYGPPAGFTVGRPPASITSVWSFPADFHATRIDGAIARCASGSIFANARYGGAHLQLADAATGALRTDAILAGGRFFATEDALAEAGATPGLLGNATATVALTEGQPAFLVGSTDGYLYAVDPCVMPARLLWSLNFRAPVGQAILADTDADGMDEIVVESADGFLYGVDTELFPAPAYVNDIDPARGMTAMDVDETRGSEITATWAEVTGATGYEWAVFTIGGTPLSRNPTDPANPFTQVDAATRIARHGEALVTGGRYFFAVRAIGAMGASSEAVSDGTRFVREVLPTPDAGMQTDSGVLADGTSGSDAARDGGDARADGGTMSPGGGCGCRVLGGSRAGREAIAGGASVIGLVMFGGLRRRSRRSRTRTRTTR